MPTSKIAPQYDQRWRQIALVWAKIATVPLTQPDRAIKRLMNLLREILGANYAWCVVMVRTEDESAARKFGVVAEWVPMVYMTVNMDDVKPEVDAEFTRVRVKRDRWTIGRLSGAGEHRTHIREDILGDEPWSACETGWHIAQYGITDRMNMVHAITPDIEFHLGLDRVGPPQWTQAEKAWLHDLNLGLTPFCARLAMSYGLIVDQKVLAPRERETLLHLLDGEPEAIIAHDMGISPGTVHQYVMSIFRKFGVNSRSELMSKWMSSGSSDSAEAMLERELASTLVNFDDD